MGAREEENQHLVGSVDHDRVDQPYGARLWDDVLVEVWQYAQGKVHADEGGAAPWSKGGWRTVTMTVVFACMATWSLALVFNDCNDGSKLYIDGIERTDKGMSPCSYGIE